MKILYAINSGNFGGAEVHNLDLVEGMHNRGHKVYVWCPEGPFAEEYRKAGAEVINITIGPDIDPTYIIALTKFLKEKQIDILHAHELKAVGNALIAGFFAGTKVKISHTHTPISEWQISPTKRFLNMLFNSLFVNLFSTREIALTPSRQRVKMEEGIREGKLAIIPNSVDLEDFNFSAEKRTEFRKEIRSRYSIPQDAYVFGNIGRLSIEKGLPVLIDGFAKFLQNPQIDYENTYLLIEGAGDLENSLREQIQNHGITDRVVMPATRYTDEDKPKILVTLDCFVFPSLAEGFGIVPIEAMAMYVPVIASDLEVLQEVSGSQALFFETGNANNLAEKMFNLYSKRDRLENVVEEGRRRVEQLYTRETFLNNYENLYLELLEDARG